MFLSGCRHIPVVLLMIIAAVLAEFDPYQLNGGLVTGVAGKDFSVIASDTRMVGEGGYQLASRSHLATRIWTVDDTPLIQNVEDYLHATNIEVEKEIRLPKSTVTSSPIFVGSSGCSADCEALKRVVRADLRAAIYLGNSIKGDADQMATLLSQILYLRRGFPYYSFCVVSGMDRNGGGGKAFVYDAIGSYEQVAVASAGTGRELLQPILDRSFECSNNRRQVEGTADQAVATLVHAYRSVSEREIGVGDKLVLCVTERRGGGDVDCRVIIVPLKEH
jgi:20S proteasome subunit beta 6